MKILYFFKVLFFSIIVLSASSCGDNDNEEQLNDNKYDKVKKEEALYDAYQKMQKEENPTTLNLNETNDGWSDEEYDIINSLFDSLLDDDINSLANSEMTDEELMNKLFNKESTSFDYNTTYISDEERIKDLVKKAGNATTEKELDDVITEANNYAQSLSNLNDMQEFMEAFQSALLGIGISIEIKKIIVPY